MTLAQLPEIQALSPRDKLELVDELWIDVIHNLDSVDVSPAEKTLLDERWDRFITDPDSALSLDAFKVRLGELRS